MLSLEPAHNWFRRINLNLSCGRHRSERAMWRITVVMLVTAVFAGLLIHDRSRLSSQSAALPINMPPRPANGAPVLAQAKTVPAAEAPATTMRPQSVQVGGPVLAQAKTVPAAEAPATTMRPQSVQVGGPVPAQAKT